MKKPEIALKGIRADEMSFRLNNVRPQGERLDLKPVFSRRIRRSVENERLCFVTITVRIESKADSPKPFDLYVAVTGIFETPLTEDETEKHEAVIACTEVVFPYLRSAVTNLTTAAMSAPLVLPVMSGPIFPEDRNPGDRVLN